MLPACGQPPLSFCTLEARASVVVTVVDARGNLVRDARVTFTHEGGPEQPALCHGTPRPPGACDRWVAEYEKPGHYVLTATSADGQRTARQEVSVDEDTCHVLTQTVRLTLPD